jgi:hypothetical protein
LRQLQWSAPPSARIFLINARTNSHFLLFSVTQMEEYTCGNLWVLASISLNRPARKESQVKESPVRIGASQREWCTVENHATI